MKFQQCTYKNRVWQCLYFIFVLGSKLKLSFTREQIYFSFRQRDMQAYIGECCCKNVGLIKLILKKSFYGSLFSWQCDDLLYFCFPSVFWTRGGTFASLLLSSHFLRILLYVGRTRFCIFPRHCQISALKIKLKILYIFIFPSFKFVYLICSFVRPTAPHRCFFQFPKTKTWIWTILSVS